LPVAAGGSSDKKSLKSDIYLYDCQLWPRRGRTATIKEARLDDPGFSVTACGVTGPGGRGTTSPPSAPRVWPEGSSRTGSATTGACHEPISGKQSTR
jgi:hypothetical protein